MNKKLIILCGIIITIFSTLFYFFYWTKTPTYSINIIRDSITNHDILKFEKHVDMDKIYSKAFDDSAIAIDKIEGDSILTSTVGLAFLEMHKPQTLRAMKNETLEIVMGNTIAKSKERTESEKFVFNIRERLDILDTKNIEVKNISLVNEENNFTLMSISIFNRHLDKEFNIIVKMEKLYDGSWKIIEICNMVELFLEVDKQYNAKLSELNEPIFREINKSLIIYNKNIDLQLSNLYDYYYYELLYDVIFENKTTKDIKDFGYTVYYMDNKSREIKVLQTYIYDGLIVKPNSKVTIRKKDFVSQQDASDKYVIDNFNELSFNVRVEAIRFTDGDVIKPMLVLP